MMINNFLIIITVLGSLASFVPLLLPSDNWKTKAIHVGYSLIIAFLTVVGFNYEAQLAKINKIEESAQSLIKIRNSDFTDEGYAQAVLTFLEKYKKDYPDTYKRALQICDAYDCNKSAYNKDIPDDLKHKLGMTDLKFLMDGILQGMAVLQSSHYEKSENDRREIVETSNFFSNWLEIILSALLGWIIKGVLNFNFAHKLVKHLSWTLFPSNKKSLRGKWRNYWKVKSKNFPDEENRHGTAEMWQWRKYCYAEFSTYGEQYILFGVMRDDYLVGHWYDAKDRWGYSGAFELIISNSNKLSGRWLGHSKEKHRINTNVWLWERP